MNNILKPHINQAEWFRHWFNSSFYHQLYSNRNEQEAADFIDQLLEYLQPPPNSDMLDLGCGNGRHARYLASKNFNVTGMDLAPASIRTAKRSESGNLKFHRHDMREPFGQERFDYIFNFFTSFGYFKEEKENHEVIWNMFTALKPGGTVVIDYLNVAYAEERLVPEENKEIDGILYHINRWSDDKYFFKNIAIDDVTENGSFEYLEQISKLDIQDFEYLFTANGLRLHKVYGDYQLNEYNAQLSPRLILIAKKPASTNHYRTSGVRK